MKRLTTETPKDNLEMALNLFYIKDHETWVRGYGPAPEYADVSLFDLTRNIVKTHIPDVELPEDDDNLSNMMSEWLMDGIESAEGIVALLYTAAWAYAELRHKLMRYEDTGLEPEEIIGLKNTCEQLNGINDSLFKANQEMGKDLAEWKKAHDEGRLVVLPCKVGDVIRFVSQDKQGYTRYEVISFNVDQGETFIVASCIPGSSRLFSVSDIGKTVFLTREEAEAALKGDNSHA